MNLLFLGTSSGWPLPRLGCNCNICTSSDSKDKRLRPSILINDKLLVDAPQDAYHQITKFKKDPTKISYILLTHAHDDHISGLYDLSHIYGLKSRTSLVSTIDVISEAKRKLNVSLLSFKIKVVRPLEKVELDKDILVWFIPVIHTVPAYAVKIKLTKPVVYAPEFRRILPSSRRQLGNLDVAVLDGSSKTSFGQAKGHETIEEGIRLGKEIGARKIYFTNIGHKTDVHDKLDQFVKETGGQKFSIAFDGLEIKL